MNFERCTWYMPRCSSQSGARIIRHTLRDDEAERIMLVIRSYFRQIPRISVQYRSMKVVPVPVRDDNYAYLLIDEPTKKAAAIDPFDVSKVSAAANAHGVEIIAGITTHHHFDHSGGNKVCDLLSTFSMSSDS
jgi:hypothetical protein